MEFSPESRYDWSTPETRWKWLGIKKNEYHLDLEVCAGLWYQTPREYLIKMSEMGELKGKAEKDAKLLKDNPSLQWGFE